jgi:murein L,D-transpeptidase YafK
MSGFTRITRLASPLSLARAGALVAGLTALAGCQEGVQDNRSMKALSSETVALMAAKGVSVNSPMLIRAYKKEAEFEVWKMRPDGTYVYLKTFPICRWSGQLGPKRHEGDRQSPEGFYTFTPAQMNPNSNYYLSFNIGYPNAYDKAQGSTGGLVMVHGVCSSAGCFSMTDAQIAEIYALARESFAGGQRGIQMQAYPFHMNVQNMAAYRLDPNMPFWKELKKGNDHFEVTKQDVVVGVCNKHYVFDARSANGAALDPEGACPPLREDPGVKQAVAERERADETAVAELAPKVKPVRLVYQDGGQHPVFAHRFAEVSRPEAAVAPPMEIAMDDPRASVGRAGKTRRDLGDTAVQVALAAANPAAPVAAPAAPQDTGLKLPPMPSMTSMFSGDNGPDTTAGIAPRTPARDEMVAPAPVPAASFTAVAPKPVAGLAKPVKALAVKDLVAKTAGPLAKPASRPASASKQVKDKPIHAELSAPAANKSLPGATLAMSASLR